MGKRQLTWMISGIGLIICGAAAAVRGAFPGLFPSFTLTLVGVGAFAVSLILIGVGLSRDSSVVGRRPLGVVAMLVLAVWPVFSLFLVPLPAAAPPPGDPLLLVYGITSLLVPLAASAVAALEIARARVVPSPWRWAPSWALAAVVAVNVLAQGLMLVAGPERVQHFAGLIIALETMAFSAAVVGLGVLAIVLATRGAEPSHASPVPMTESRAPLAEMS